MRGGGKRMEQKFETPFVRSGGGCRVSGSGWRFAVVLMGFAVLTSVAFGEKIEVDVGAWVETKTGTTADGWKVEGVKGYADDGGAMFSDDSNYALSPVFENCVTQVVMRVKSSSTNVVKILTVTPTIPDGETPCKAKPTDGKYEEQTFAWENSEGVRQFRLQESSGTSGNWGVAALTVYTDRISAPVDLRSTATNCDAFVAAWTPDVKAVASEIAVSRVEVTPPRYDVVSEWNFTALTNATGNTKGLEELRTEFPGVLDDVSGENLCLQASFGGHLQVGKSKVAGSLSLELGDSARSRTCSVTAWRHPKDKSSGCSAFCLDADGRTNAVIGLTVAANAVTDVFAIPDESVRLRVESLQSRRIELASVIVSTHYEEGYASTNSFGRYRALRSEVMVKGLFPGEWVWRARSFDAENVVSAWSSFSGVTLDPKSPRRVMPGFSILVR